MSEERQTGAASEAGGRGDRPAVITLTEKFALFSDHWSPKIVASLNDYDIKLAKVQGDFPWHTHDDTDELFLVIEGALTIELRDGAVQLGAGDLFVVPRGAEHRPIAAEEVRLLLLEPRGTVNTGAVRNERTVTGEQRI